MYLFLFGRLANYLDYDSPDGSIGTYSKDSSTPKHYKAVSIRSYESDMLAPSLQDDSILLPTSSRNIEGHGKNDLIILQLYLCISTLPWEAVVNSAGGDLACER